MLNTVNQEKRSREEEPTKLSFYPDLFLSSPGYFYNDCVAEAPSLSMMDKSLRSYTTYLPNQIRRF